MAASLLVYRQQWVDILRGKAGEGILISIYIIYGNNFVALSKIMAEWTNMANDYATRITNIKTGAGLTQGTTLTVASILEDSGAIDNLFGGTADPIDNDLDWFFRKNPSDVIAEVQANEQVEVY